MAKIKAAGFDLVICKAFVFWHTAEIAVQGVKAIIKIIVFALAFQRTKLCVDADEDDNNDEKNFIHSVYPF